MVGIKEKLSELFSWKKPKIGAISMEWIRCKKCGKRFKIGPDETPDDCAKRFGLKRIIVNVTTF